MESKLITGLILGCLLIVSGCSATTDKPVDLVKTDTPLYSGLSVNQPITTVEALIIPALTTKTPRVEQSFAQSQLVPYFKQTQGDFDINRLTASKMQERFYQVNKQIKQLGLPNEAMSVYRLRYEDILHTASYTGSNKPLRLYGEFELVLAKAPNNHTQIYIFGDDLRVLYGYGCSIHSFDCGKRSYHLDNAPLEQHRILLYLQDVLSTQDMQFSWQKKIN